MIINFHSDCYVGMPNISLGCKIAREFSLAKAICNIFFTYPDNGIHTAKASVRHLQFGIQFFLISYLYQSIFFQECPSRFNDCNRLSKSFYICFAVKRIFHDFKRNSLFICHLKARLSTNPIFTVFYCLLDGEHFSS